MKIKTKGNPKSISDHAFKPSPQGYEPEEVDEFLDEIVEDYLSMGRLIKDLFAEREASDSKLRDANAKNELLELKNKEYEDEYKKLGENGYLNHEVLKRISNLEANILELKKEKK